MVAARVKLTAVVAVVGALGVGGVATAGGGGGHARGHHDGNGTAFRAFLQSYEEVPAISSPARATFRATVIDNGTAIAWELRYRGLEADAQQAHVHFGQRKVNGGISVFLCSNLPEPPAGTQPCPAREARLTGTIRADSVIGPAVQGIEPGAFGELLAAMRAGVTYANVHSAKFPAGEIRGQVKGWWHHR